MYRNEHYLTILSFSKVRDFICAHSLTWNLPIVSHFGVFNHLFGHALMVEISLFTHAIISWLIMCSMLGLPLHGLLVLYGRRFGLYMLLSN